MSPSRSVQRRVIVKLIMSCCLTTLSLPFSQKDKSHCRFLLDDFQSHRTTFMVVARPPLLLLIENVTGRNDIFFEM